MISLGYFCKKHLQCYTDDDNIKFSVHPAMPIAIKSSIAGGSSGTITRTRRDVDEDAYCLQIPQRA